MAARDRITARDRDRAIKASDKAKLRSLAARVTAAKAAILREATDQKKARRAFLRRLRKASSALPSRKERTERAAKVRALSKELDRFRAWWASVLLERDARKAALVEARAELRAWKSGAKSRRKALKNEAQQADERRLEAFDDDQSRAFEVKADAVAKAKRALADERADQRALSRNAGDRKRAAPRTTKAERAVEFTGGVEANLDGAIEFAVWKKARKQILAAAKATNVSSPDGVAELVREYAELNEEQALDWLANDVESWVEAEWARENAA
jgi:hypothetical protein